MSQDRFNNDKYVNWLKEKLCLQYAKEGIEPITNTQVDTFHTRLCSIVQKPSSSSATVAPSLCLSCTKEDLQKQWRKQVFSCIYGVCDQWLTELQQQHVTPASRVEWDNFDVSKLPVSPWECAKLYLPYGSQKITCARDADLAAILTLYQNCKHFEACLHDATLCEKVKDIRNRLFHTGTMEVEPAQMQLDVALIKQLLNDPKTCASDPHCQAALDKIDTLLKSKLEVSQYKELELRLINAKVIKHAEVLDQLKDNVKQHKDTLEQHDGNLRQHREELDQHKDKLKQNKDQLNQHDTYLEVHRDELCQHKDKLERHEGNLEQQRKELNQHNDKLDQHNNKLKEHDDNIEQHGEELGLHKDKLEMHKGKIEQHDSNLKQYGAKLDGQKEMLDKHGNELNQLVEKLDQHDNELHRHRQRFNQHSVELERLDRHEDALEQHNNKLEQQKGKLEHHGEKLDGHEIKLEQYNGKLDKCRDKLNQCERKIDRFELQGDTLNRHGERLDYHEDKIDALEQEQMDQKRKLHCLEPGTASKKDPNNPDNDKISALQQHLVDVYSGECYWENPLTGDEQVDISRMYVKPAIKHVRQRNDNKGLDEVKQRPKDYDTFALSYRHVFYTNTEQCKNIYITGDAGMGKTAFCKQVVNTWCKAVQGSVENREPDDDLSILKDFKLLFYLSLRECETYYHIEDIIRDNLLRNFTTGLDFNFSDILQTEKCLVVLDGLDEWSCPPKARICRGLNKGIPGRNTTNKTCVYLTTTRSWKFDVLDLQTKDVDKHIELCGIGKESSREFAEKTIEYLNSNSQIERTFHEIDDFQKEVNSKKLESLTNVPVFFTQLLTLWYFFKDLGKSRVQLYCKMLNLLFERATKHLSETTITETIYSDADLPECFSEEVSCHNHAQLLRCLSELAFKSLFSKPREESLVFKSAKLKIFGIVESDITLCLKCGILTQNKEFGNLTGRFKRYSFLHKKLQEFLGAFYLVTSDAVDDNMRQVKRYCDRLDTTLEMGHVFVCVCGMRNDVGKLILEHIKYVISKDKSIQKSRCTSLPEFWIRNIQTCLIDCYAEGANNCQIYTPDIDDYWIDKETITDFVKYVVEPKNYYMKSVYIDDCYRHFVPVVRIHLREQRALNKVWQSATSDVLSKGSLIRIMVKNDETINTVVSEDSHFVVKSKNITLQKMLSITFILAVLLGLGVWLLNKKGLGIRLHGRSWRFIILIPLICFAMAGSVMELWLDMVRRLRMFLIKDLELMLGLGQVLGLGMVFGLLIGLGLGLGLLLGMGLGLVLVLALVLVMGLGSWLVVEFALTLGQVMSLGLELGLTLGLGLGLGFGLGLGLTLGMWMNLELGLGYAQNVSLALRFVLTRVLQQQLGSKLEVWQVMVFGLKLGLTIIIELQFWLGLTIELEAGLKLVMELKMVVMLGLGLALLLVLGLVLGKKLWLAWVLWLLQVLVVCLVLALMLGVRFNFYKRLELVIALAFVLELVMAIVLTLAKVLWFNRDLEVKVDKQMRKFTEMLDKGQLLCLGGIFWIWLGNAHVKTWQWLRCGMLLVLNLVRWPSRLQGTERLFRRKNNCVNHDKIHSYLPKQPQYCEQLKVLLYCDTHIGRCRPVLDLLSYEQLNTIEVWRFFVLNIHAVAETVDSVCLYEVVLLNSSLKRFMYAISRSSKTVKVLLWKAIVIDDSTIFENLVTDYSTVFENLVIDDSTILENLVIDDSTIFENLEVYIRSFDNLTVEMCEFRPDNTWWVQFVANK